MCVRNMQVGLNAYNEEHYSEVFARARYNRHVIIYVRIVEKTILSIFM
jgi:hypothetical protein